MFFEISFNDHQKPCRDMLVKRIKSQPKKRFAESLQTFDTYVRVDHVVFSDSEKRYMVWDEYLEYIEELKREWWPRIETVSQVPDFMLPFILDEFCARFRVPREVVLCIKNFTSYYEKHAVVPYRLNVSTEVQYKDMPRMTSNAFKSILWVLFSKIVSEEAIPAHIEMASVTIASSQWWGLLPEKQTPEQSNVLTVLDSFKNASDHSALLEHFGKIQQVTTMNHVSQESDELYETDVETLTPQDALERLKNERQWGEWYQLTTFLKRTEEKYTCLVFPSDVPLYYLEKIVDHILDNYSFSFSDTVRTQISTMRFKHQPFIIAPESWVNTVQTWIMPLLACQSNFTRRFAIPLAPYALWKYHEKDYFFTISFLKNVLDPLGEISGCMMPNDPYYMTYGLLDKIISKIDVYPGMIASFSQVIYFTSNDTRYTGIKRGIPCLLRAVSAFIHMKKLHTLNDAAKAQIFMSNNPSMMAIHQRMMTSGNGRLSMEDLVQIYRFIADPTTSPERTRIIFYGLQTEEDVKFAHAIPGLLNWTASSNYITSISTTQISKGLESLFSLLKTSEAMAYREASYLKTHFKSGRLDMWRGNTPACPSTFEDVSKLSFKKPLFMMDSLSHKFYPMTSVFPLKRAPFQHRMPMGPLSGTSSLFFETISCRPITNCMDTSDESSSE